MRGFELEPMENYPWIDTSDQTMKYPNGTMNPQICVKNCGVGKYFEFRSLSCRKCAFGCAKNNKNSTEKDKEKKNWDQVENRNLESTSHNESNHVFGDEKVLTKRHANRIRSMKKTKIGDDLDLKSKESFLFQDSLKYAEIGQKQEDWKEIEVEEDLRLMADMETYAGEKNSNELILRIMKGLYKKVKLVEERDERKMDG